MPIDFDGLVLRPSMTAFARTVTVTPEGGPAFAARGDFRQEPVEFEVGESVHTAVTPTLGVRLADWETAPVQGMAVAIDGVDYVVDDIDGPDGEGGARLILKKVVA